MEDPLISLEVAKLAKEKEFTLNSCSYYQYLPEGEIRYKFISEEDDMGTWVNQDPENRIAVCTQTLLKNWLRENHSISIIVDDFITNSKIRYDVCIKELGQEDYSSEEEVFKTYEEALELGLKKGLKLI